jgi:small-conductance mechanosensitive channel
MNHYRITLSLILALFWVVSLYPATGAAQTPTDDPVKQAEQDITKLEQTPLTPTKVTKAKLDELIARVTAARGAMLDCIGATKDELARLSADLDTLGQEITGEAAEVAGKRGSLGREAARLEQRLAHCRLLSLRGKKLLADAMNFQRSVFTKRLFDQGPSFPEVVRSNLGAAQEWWTFLQNLVVQDSGLKELSRGGWLGLGVTALACLAIGFAGRRKLLGRVEKLPKKDGMTSALSRASITSIGHYLPYLLTSATLAACLSFLIPDKRLPVITVVSYGALLYVVMITLISLVLTPPKPAEPWLPLQEDLATALARRFRILALMLLLGFSLFASLLPHSLPELLYLFTRDLYMGFLVLNLAWVTWLAVRLPETRHAHRLGILLSLSFAAALAAEWLGYRQLTEFILVGVTATLLGFGLAVLLSRLFSELFDGLDEGRHAWQRGLRSMIGVSRDEYVPGLNWLRVLTYLSLWAGFGLVVLYVWGLSDAGFTLIKQHFNEGFPIGGFTVVPKQILWAMLVFALLLTTTRWFKKTLAQHWIKKLRVDRGAREAIVTTSGYVGAIIALMVALSVAGIDFTNLAIVAGALSVGIGFGMQNIVNNFISGLILLVERPIKTGDWIVAGGTEGVVKRIHIRYTHVQTFDRADVIVPNSELISGPVTNWVLSDHFGRVSIQIGVSYGVEPAKVKEVLLNLARAHPQVIHGHPEIPEPYVLFLSFGENILNFQLSCFIRDVTKRGQVKSDMNFAIDAAFREQGIEMPMSKRDVIIHNWPEAAPRPAPPGESA